MSQDAWIRGLPHQKFLCPFIDIFALYHQLDKPKYLDNVTKTRTLYPSLLEESDGEPHRLPCRHS
ncbi:hypothetical protein RDI58_010615 [Solanum bulbocastanum]|uniref:Uncharacterized protein n=1 Tax=Solanum bulbocastanum TaxID=147425 RepID=A0AAN8TPR9_SOLBU